MALFRRVVSVFCGLAVALTGLVPGGRFHSGVFLATSIVFLQLGQSTNWPTISGGASIDCLQKGHSKTYSLMIVFLSHNGLAVALRVDDEPAMAGGSREVPAICISSEAQNCSEESIYGHAPAHFAPLPTGPGVSPRTATATASPPPSPPPLPAPRHSPSQLPEVRADSERVERERASQRSGQRTINGEQGRTASRGRGRRIRFAVGFSPDGRRGGRGRPKGWAGRKWRGNGKKYKPPFRTSGAGRNRVDRKMTQKVAFGGIRGQFSGVAQKK